MLKKIIMFSMLILFGIVCWCGTKQDDSQLQCSDTETCDIESQVNNDDDSNLPPLAGDNNWESETIQDSAANEV